VAADLGRACQDLVDGANTSAPAVAGGRIAWGKFLVPGC
jgi:hypothetical protein